MGFFIKDFRHFLSLALGTLFFFGSLGQGQAAWKEEWEKTVKAAKKEGKVVVSIPASSELRKQMEEAFEKRFAGIDLETVAGRGSKSVRRIVDEYRAGVRYFDAHLGGSSSLVTGLLHEEILDPVEAYMILPEVKEPKNWWGGHIYVDKAKRFAYAFQAYLSDNLYYNEKLVKPEEVRTMDDLLNPKLKGKIGFLDPRTPGGGSSTWSFMWKLKGKDFLEKLVRQEVFWSRNQRQLAEALAEGKVAVTIGLTYYSFRPFIEAGLPIKSFPTLKEGTYISTGSGNLAIIKEPPHPNATKVFVNWLLSHEGQEVFTRAMGQATRRLDVDTQWTQTHGIVAAKDRLRPADFPKFENQSEDKVVNVRVPARKLAKELLK